MPPPPDSLDQAANILAPPGAIHLSLIERCATEHDALPTAVIHPCDMESLQGAVRAAEKGLIAPVLVGPEAKIKATAEQSGFDIAPYDLVTTPHSHAAAERAVELVRAGQVRCLLKGSLHTDEVMHPVAARQTGLRTERRISHVFAMDLQDRSELLFITDAAINIFPDLEAKRDIVQNAIMLASAIGMEARVAILTAVETVTPKIPSTIEAAALCKMAERGQIEGGILDGPLALDNAIDIGAADIKGLHSPVAGRANILVTPDLEAGNMLAKNLSFLAGAIGAGIVLGARVPIILTSRADGLEARLASCALAGFAANAGTGK